MGRNASGKDAECPESDRGLIVGIRSPPPPSTKPMVGGGRLTQLLYKESWSPRRVQAGSCSATDANDTQRVTIRAVIRNSGL